MKLTAHIASASNPARAAPTHFKVTVRWNIAQHHKALAKSSEPRRHDVYVARLKLLAYREKRFKCLAHDLSFLSCANASVHCIAGNHIAGGESHNRYKNCSASNSHFI